MPEQIRKNIAAESADHSTSEDRTYADELRETIQSLVEQHPELQDVDLIVEAGVGTGIAMPEALKASFPKGFYVGTDLSPQLLHNRHRLRKSISAPELERVQAANSSLSGQAREAILFANCFDFDLIKDIADKTDSSTPMLASVNAIYALSSKEINHWEKKSQEDRIGLGSTFSDESPYKAQIHLFGAEWFDDDTTGIGQSVSFLERTAAGAGWRAERLRSGLLLLPPTSLSRKGK